ncbi:Fic family protein [soil metagenome]
MRRPVEPPSLHSYLGPNSESGPLADRLFRIMLSGNIRSDDNGKYRHWDTLRHCTVPSGLDATHEEWWLAMKLARVQQRRELPLRTTSNSPMWLTSSDLLYPYLQLVDQQTAGSIHAPSFITDTHLRDRYLFTMLTEEAITSSQLEGASTTRRVAREMIRTGRQPTTRSERMIMNNFHAMEFVRIHAQESITQALIFQLHHIVTEGTLDSERELGAFREHSDDIVIEDERGNLLHRPPRADELPTRIASLCAFANSTPTPYLHPVLKSIIIHFWLAYDHPFVDGNGRTARLLFYWSMLHHGYWLAEYLSISTILRNAPSRYAKSFLYVESDEHDLTYFVLNQLGVIKSSIDHLMAHLRRKDKEMTETRKLMSSIRIDSKDLNHRQLAILTHALKHAYNHYTIHSHQVSHGVSYLTSRSDLLALVDRGLLDKTSVGNTLHFIAPADLMQRIARLASSSTRSL